MGIFDRFKSQRDLAKDEIKEVKWLPLESVDQVDAVIEESKAVPALIFKHSSTCGISRMVLRQFEQDYDIEDGALQPYFLDLRSYRDISNAIATKFGVRHESPQILLIKNGESVYDASHGGIDFENVKSRL